jgi:glycerophosphoryl diester phosphodiesterase
MAKRNGARRLEQTGPPWETVMAAERPSIAAGRAVRFLGGMQAQDPPRGLGKRLVAHRGWAARYPENTLAAVRGALEAGAAAVEIDVQLSLDGVPHLFHDRTLERLCGVSGSLGQRTRAELERLSASERGRFADRYAREPIAALEAFVQELTRWPEAFAFVELKRVSLERFGREPVLERVLPVLEPLAGRAALISFDLDVLRRARERSRWPIGPVFERWGESERAAWRELGGATGCEFLFCDVDGLPCQGKLELEPGEFGRTCEMVVYEVDRPEVARELFARGVARVETFAIGELLADLSRD